MRRELCVDTFKAAADRLPIKGATLHSDRGSQYTSEDFRAALAKQDVSQSLSGVDHCYDNARMESFFATLKKETPLQDSDIQDEERSSENEYIQICLRLLQQGQDIYFKSGWTSSGSVPKADGRKQVAGCLKQFCGFTDCTIIDNSK